MPPDPFDLPRPARRLALPVLIALLAALYLPLLGRVGFIGPDEPRYARIGWEMLSREDPVVPTLEDRPWLEKPPLLYWLMMAAYRLCGPGEFAARLPAAVCALITVAGLFLALRPVYGTRAAWLAGLALGTAPLFLGFAVAAATDMPFTACLTLGMLLLWRALGGDGVHCTGRLAAAAACLGLAVLAKGPLALILAGLAVWPVLGLTGGWSRLLHRRGLLAAGVLAAVILPWHILIYAREGSNFILVYVINHHLARYFTPIHHHNQPIWFYLPVLAAALLPWTALLGPAIREGWGQLRRRPTTPGEAGVLFLMGWLLLPLLFLSLSQAKLPGYILPLLPALAALLGISLDRRLRRNGEPGRLPTTLGALAGLLLVVGLPLGLDARFDVGGLSHWWGLAALPGVLVLVTLHRRRPDTALAGLALCVILPAGWAGPALLTRLEPHLSRRPIMVQANALCPLGTPPLVIYRHQNHAHDYYSDYTCSANQDSLEALAAYLTEHPSPAIVLTRERHLLDFHGLVGWTVREVGSAGADRLLRLDRAPPAGNGAGP